MSREFRDLDEWLDAVQVDTDVVNCGTEEIRQPAVKYLDGWCGVSTDDDGGFIAYFRDERDAFAFRLNYINQKMNGIPPQKKPK